jgi:hypothetical protein
VIRKLNHIRSTGIVRHAIMLVVIGSARFREGGVIAASAFVGRMGRGWPCAVLASKNIERRPKGAPMKVDLSGLVTVVVLTGAGAATPACSNPAPAALNPPLSTFNNFAFECEEGEYHTVYTVSFDTQEARVSITEGSITIYQGRVTKFFPEPHWVTDKFGQNVNDPVFSVADIEWFGGSVSAQGAGRSPYVMMFKNKVWDCIIKQ